MAEFRAVIDQVRNRGTQIVHVVNQLVSVVNNTGDLLALQKYFRELAATTRISMEEVHERLQRV